MQWRMKAAPPDSSRRPEEGRKGRKYPTGTSLAQQLLRKLLSSQGYLEDMYFLAKQEV
ncbi:Hypothetical protein DEACI_3260 [Acididesulfobacillus acetoxydans]|uniref:Uncharacterized protein n=1 Tax=Acididesulfobacillus acetoxydans TaxID=1561005 RepID=A0A8S0X0H5_9FIRM|nr:Hypothetical protein DEACI_3260 [Acididesulfobacillus acetoxydans]CEJ07273.1 Hypothetical protein DEACI_1734 [Acididesulfobacillus acetoxydans]